MVERFSKFFGGLVRRFAVWVHTPDSEEWQQMRQNDLATIAALGKKMPIGEETTTHNRNYQCLVKAVQ